MSIVRDMMEVHPAVGSLELDPLITCLESCIECAWCCTACADACLSEDDLAALARCIRLNADCADICAATSRVLTRQSITDPALTRQTLELCAAACRACAEECAGHADHHDHCRICAECCRQCEQACNDLLNAML